MVSFFMVWALVGKFFLLQRWSFFFSVDTDIILQIPSRGSNAGFSSDSAADFGFEFARIAEPCHLCPLVPPLAVAFLLWHWLR